MQFSSSSKTRRPGAIAASSTGLVRRSSRDDANASSTRRSVRSASRSLSRRARGSGRSRSGSRRGRRTRRSGSRKKGDLDVEEQPQKLKEEQPKKLKKEKEFAWMDSDEEEDAASADREPSVDAQRVRRSRSRSRKVPAVPKSAAEVQNFVEMNRLAASWRSGTLLRMPLAELAAICQAAARVRYYDGSVFGDVIVAIRSHLRGTALQKPDVLAAIVSSLVELNAYDKALFDAVAKAMDNHGVQMEPPTRKLIVQAFYKSKHPTDSPVLELLRDIEAGARYNAACEQVKASWQSGDKVTGPAMGCRM